MAALRMAVIDLNVCRERIVDVVVTGMDFSMPILGFILSLGVLIPTVTIPKISLITCELAELLLHRRNPAIRPLPIPTTTKAGGAMAVVRGGTRTSSSQLGSYLPGGLCASRKGRSHYDNYRSVGSFAEVPSGVNPIFTLDSGKTSKLMASVPMPLD
jgi:hypothetical protein